MNRTIFDEAITRTWWEAMEKGIADGVLVSGEDYLIINGNLHLSFTPVYGLYLDRIIRKELPREWLLNDKQLKKLLKADRYFLWETRKRMGPTVNIRVMVWRWNKQVHLPARKLRKVG